MTPAIVPTINEQTPAPLLPRGPAYGVFATADRKQLSLSIAGEDRMWRDVCGILQLRDLADLSEQQRLDDRTAIQLRLRAAIAERSFDWLFDNFKMHKIAFGPVRRPAEVSADPHVAARQLLIALSGSDTKIRHYIRQPLLLDGEAGTIGSRAPLLGEHTDELLQVVGYDAEQLRRLRTIGAVGPQPS
jgi:crotonobetainyl-CoA:carnitine CoA-transferase CaiB-like acyl-CoA transferase